MEVTVSLKKKQPRKEWFVAFLAFRAVVDIAPGCSVVFLKKCVFYVLLHIRQLVSLETSLSCGHILIPLSFGKASVNNKLETVCSPFTPYIFSTVRTQADLYC